MNNKPTTDVERVARAVKDATKGCTKLLHDCKTHEPDMYGECSECGYGDGKRWDGEYVEGNVYELQAKAAIAALTEPTRKELRDHPLFKFLLGEGEYKGMQFGDHVMHGRYKARYWWRTDLRELLKANVAPQGGLERPSCCREMFKNPSGPWRNEELPEGFRVQNRIFAADSKGDALCTITARSFAEADYYARLLIKADAHLPTPAAGLPEEEDVAVEIIRKAIMRSDANKERNSKYPAMAAANYISMALEVYENLKQHTTGGGA